jgi:hypothetical protein
VLFARLTALDLIGPYEVLQRLPGATVTFVGHRRGEVRTDNGFLSLTVDATFDELPRPDVIVVPGGIGTRALLANRCHHDEVMRTSISMTDDQMLALRRLAAVRRRSQASLLRDAIDRLLRDDTLTRRAAIARDVIGAFRSGTRDASEQHDQIVVRHTDA